MMENVEREILKIVAELNDGQAVNLRSIDLRLIKVYPDVIFDGRLLSIVRKLIDANYLMWSKENASVIITYHGKMLLNSFN